MKELGLAVLNTNNGLHPELASMFNAGGFSEITPAPQNAQLFSFEDFKQTEERLVQTPENIDTPPFIEHSEEVAILFRANEHATSIENHDDLKLANIGHTDARETHVKNADRGYEIQDHMMQSGDPETADPDIAMANNRRKGGGANQSGHNEKKSKRSYDNFVAMQLQNQSLEQYIVALETRIAELNKEVEAYNREISKLDSLINFIEEGHDLNSANPEARKQKKFLLEMANQKGLDVKKDPEGKIDNLGAKELLDDIIDVRSDTEIAREKATEELEETKRTRNVALQRLESDIENNTITTEEATQTADGQLLSMDEEKVLEASGFDNFSDLLKNDEQTGFGAAPTTSAFQPVRTIGSVADDIAPINEGAQFGVAEAFNSAGFASAETIQNSIEQEYSYETSTQPQIQTLQL